MAKILLFALLGLGFFIPSPYISKVTQVPIEDKLMGLYRKYDVLFPNIVIRQSRLETGNFTSKISIENLNQWGLKYSKSRNFSTGKVNGHACYPSIEAGVQDYAQWQKQMIKLHNKSFPNHKLTKDSSEEDYYWFLDHLFLNGKDTMTYAEDRLYSKKLRQIGRINDHAQ